MDNHHTHSQELAIMDTDTITMEVKSVKRKVQKESTLSNWVTIAAK